jgi:hypothetical protein
MNKSESITKLAGALVQAQSEFECVRHDSKNPFYNSKYASLGAMIASTVPTLKKYGLAISQFPTSDISGQVGVETILMHESGEWVSQSATVELPGHINKKSEWVKQSHNPAQEAGKAITYLRRYGWQAVLGVYSGDDDDAQSYGQMSSNAPVKNAPEKIKWTQEQFQAVVDTGVAKTIPHAKNILENSNIASPNNTPEWCSWYGSRYLKAKNNGLSTEDAVERVNKEYEKAQEKK